MSLQQALHVLIREKSPLRFMQHVEEILNMLVAVVAGADQVMVFFSTVYWFILQQICE